MTPPDVDPRSEALAPATPRSLGMERQLAIYRAGLAGQRPPFPVTHSGLKKAARKALSTEAYGYVAGSAGTESTARANRSAFERHRIVPRHLRGVEMRDLSIELFGQRLQAPLLLAPIGVMGILHDEAELAVARAAAAVEMPIVLSTVSSKSLEEVAAVGEGAPRWFQLYWPSDPEFARSLLDRAKVAGYSAVVVTLDTFLLAWRPRDIGHGYLPFMHGDGLSNYFSDPVFRGSLEVPPEDDPAAAVQRFATVFSNAGVTWEDLDSLAEMTDLPIVVKGVLHPEDARKALEHGADGVIVSNHGGRQVDGAIASLDALPGVVDAVEGRVPVLFDSGIRTGADVFKAIALGADATLVGRPYAYALAVGGEEAVRETLLNLLAEFDLTMGLSGCRSVEEIGRDLLTPRDG
ncbi:MAG: lactate 2-monooxygenase [Gemmatimonadota bacterium]|nr:lactate 2-monooxygenase [Gemmatimonadota bacterium]